MIPYVFASCFPSLLAGLNDPLLHKRIASVADIFAASCLAEARPLAALITAMGREALQSTISAPRNLNAASTPGVWGSPPVVNLVARICLVSTPCSVIISRLEVWDKSGDVVALLPPEHGSSYHPSFQFV